jgi:hypothetical protein
MFYSKNHKKLFTVYNWRGPRGGIDGWGGRGSESRWGGFFNWPSPSNCTVAQPLTEMITKSFPGGKGLPACRADNLIVIREPIV